MKIYHLSVDVFEDIKEFYPRVPKSVIKDEDESINRICVGLSIEDCLNGLCYMNALRDDLFCSSEDRSCYCSEAFRAVKVYEFDYDIKKLLNPSDIAKYVPDAHDTKEHWVIEPIKPIKSYLIDILDVDCNEDADIITSSKYNLISEEEFYKKAFINYKDNEIESSELEFRIPVSNNLNTIELDISKYPVKKSIIKTILKEYFCWADVDIQFI